MTKRFSIIFVTSAIVIESLLASGDEVVSPDAGPTEASAALDKLVERDNLTCSACLWTARAIRAALVEKMPQKVKSSKERYRRAAEMLAVAGEQGSCNKKFFPMNLVVASWPKSDMKPAIHDFEDIRGAEKVLKSEHFAMMGTKDTARAKLNYDCGSIVSTFRHILAKRVEAHGPRVYGAVTERWLCYRSAKLCSNEEAKPGKDDDDDDDEL
eukprot:TRINITY_DN94663_c0_g1_i1.p1 TRINITY_DN94663_c0_g1~~TRINITY_DN94663_c0_g1_i1.p1  ORF type:complete len:235 (+),score=48.55 TRINITY_DN94663_c0_g1_i1:70-705(+)